MGVKFGIIGLGVISNKFAKVLGTTDGELVAVAARDINRANEFAKKYNAKKAYASYEELLNDKEVEAVYIGLTHNFHKEFAIKCIEHGKAVMCEKPFFLNTSDAEEVFALAKQKNVLVMEAMWTRCLPTFKKAKSWIAENKIGELKLIEASFCFRQEFDANHRLFAKELAGGALYDVGVYPIEYATGIAGEKPEKIFSIVEKLPNGVDGFDLILMKFKSGVMANLKCGLNLSTRNDAILYGTRGYIETKNFYGATRIERYDESHNLVESFEEPVEDGFVYEIEHFMDLYRNGKIESDLILWQDVLDCTEIFEDMIGKYENIN